MNWTWKTRETGRAADALPEMHEDTAAGKRTSLPLGGQNTPSGVPDASLLHGGENTPPGVPALPFPTEETVESGGTLLPEPPSGARYALGSLVLRLETDKIVPNPAQPRKYFSEEAISSLADSIRRHGILQPLTVRAAADGLFELVAGERRLRAAKVAGLSRVPCLLIDTDDRTSAALAVVENVQRENLNMFEEAEAIGRLAAAYGLTQEQIAQRLSCSQSAVANKLRLLKLSKEHRAMILSSGLTERHARALLRLRDEDKRDDALRQIIGRRLNVAASEELIDRIAAGGPKEPPVRKFILRDVRIFYQSIDRAVELVRRAGVPIEEEKHDADDVTEIVLRVPNGGVSRETLPGKVGEPCFT